MRKNNKSSSSVTKYVFPALLAIVVIFALATTQLGVGNSASAATSNATPQSASSAPTITTSTLSVGNVGSAYAQTILASGGTSPYTWSLKSGALPAGLTLSSSGSISGTPTAAGTSSFVIQVKDHRSSIATKSFSITIENLSVATTLLTVGSLNTTYGNSVGATGGTAPYSWSIVGGSLPTGIYLTNDFNGNGWISGTPTAVGTSTFTVNVQDANGVRAQKTLSIVIVAPQALTLAVTCPSNVTGVIGTFLSSAYAVSGGLAPYVWSSIGGSLPNGLSLNSTNGLVSGTPTTAGTYIAIVRATDVNASIGRVICKFVISSSTPSH